jgi:hypothetical protein
VTTLLQPRDFINSHQLVIAMGLLVLGGFRRGVHRFIATLGGTPTPAPDAAR